MVILKQEKNRQSIKKRRKKKKWKRILLVALIILLIPLSYVGYLMYTAYDAANGSYEELERGDKSKLREKAVQIDKEPFSVLLMGIENYASGGKGGRSDTLMVATFDPRNETMKLLSIPRDTRLEIAETHKIDKITHSYNGGKERTIETVENFLEIPIDYYATVNFKGFVNIIDYLGGVTVDVPFDFWDYKGGDWDTKFYYTEGQMTLNGEEALTYARMRKKDPRGDFGRNDRQKQIVMAMIDKMSSPSALLKLDKVTKEIGKNVETNFKVNYLLALRENFPNFKSNKVETLTISGYDQTINSIYYFIPDETSLEETKQILKDHLNPDNIIQSGTATTDDETNIDTSNNQ